MRAANILLFASALGLSCLGVAANGPDFSLDAAPPALAHSNSIACADALPADIQSPPALRDGEDCPPVPPAVFLGK